MHLKSIEWCSAERENFYLPVGMLKKRLQDLLLAPAAAAAAAGYPLKRERVVVMMSLCFEVGSEALSSSHSLAANISVHCSTMSCLASRQHLLLQQFLGEDGAEDTYLLGTHFL